MHTKEGRGWRHTLVISKKDIEYKRISPREMLNGIPNEEELGEIEEVLQIAQEAALLPPHNWQDY